LNNVFTGNIQNSDEAFLTDTLFDIVKNNYPETGGQVDLDYESGIPDSFWTILMYNQPGSKRHVWTVEEVGDVETNFPEQLQQIIDSKAEKISQYLTKCDRCWLIIAALGISGSNFFEISEDMEQNCYKSPFEKVFFMEAFSETLKELKIKPVSEISEPELEQKTTRRPEPETVEEEEEDEEEKEEEAGRRRTSNVDERLNRLKQEVLKELDELDRLELES